jgi:hypothetical protein
MLVMSSELFWRYGCYICCVQAAYLVHALQIYESLKKVIDSHSESFENYCFVGYDSCSILARL